jgi:acyl-coenzyme A thioesterase PaaI-like protein
MGGSNTGTNGSNHRQPGFGPTVSPEFKINYVRPAVGVRLLARAHAVHAGKTQAV